MLPPLAVGGASIAAGAVVVTVRATAAPAAKAQFLTFIRTSVQLPLPPL